MDVCGVGPAALFGVDLKTRRRSTGQWCGHSVFPKFADERINITTSRRARFRNRRRNVYLLICEELPDVGESFLVAERRLTIGCRVTGPPKSIRDQAHVFEERAMRAIAPALQSPDYSLLVIRVKTTLHYNLLF